MKIAELSAMHLRDSRTGGCLIKSDLLQTSSQGFVSYFKGQSLSSISHLLSHNLAANMAGISV